MENFAEQCLDMAQSLLANNLSAVNADGSILPVEGEAFRGDEPGHVALAIGEYYRLTQETAFEGFDLVDLAARVITAQVFIDEEAENGLAYSALGLLSFSPAKERNAVWERLLDPTRETLDKKLLARSDYTNHYQAFNIAKAVARFSLGLSKKDETGKLVDKFIERLDAGGSAGFLDDHPEGLGGCYDIYGLMAFVFIRQSLQLHSNVHLRDRKMPSLRTHAGKYIKMLPDIVRQDGVGWSYGRSIGAYGQMHCISLILQALRDGWIDDSERPKYLEIMRRLFQYFFATYLDHEHGYLVIRDGERTTGANHTTRIANFDAARYLCQWARLAKSIGGPMNAQATSAKRKGRFVVFEKSNRKEHGVFSYNDPESGLHIALPLVSQGSNRDSGSLAFPHSPGVFDWPANTYLPILMPELTIGKDKVVPSFYGVRCSTGLGLRNAFYFRYEQPDFITTDEKILKGIGSCKVSWTFQGGKITSEFIFMVKNPISVERMRYVIALGSPHSRYHSSTAFCLGEESLRPNVIKDDFQANWNQLDVVTENPDYRTCWGNLHYLQVLERDHPLNMRPGQQYRLIVEFEPDIALAGE